MRAHKKALIGRLRWSDETGYSNMSLSRTFSGQSLVRRLPGALWLGLPEPPVALLLELPVAWSVATVCVTARAMALFKGLVAETAP